ncbi:DUF6708 domain-containing protein [Achromobacter sp. UBA4530]|uniref:DUF6708 domain-containing protein n=1 Tax=Achromobacter sp. UBA4530 TaxID=1945912 RepID=UPI0032E3772B
MILGCDWHQKCIGRLIWTLSRRRRRRTRLFSFRILIEWSRGIDRFQLAGSNAYGEHMWAMARAFMSLGPEALPQYPNPSRDWNKDVPLYHLTLRLAPKVGWPDDMDVESRTAP